MLNLGKGYKIYEPEKLSEAYEVSNEVSIMANVGVEKVVDVFQHFIAMYDEPLFFILELPVTCDREALIAPGVVEETHKDVYYIDGCTQEECLVLLEKYGELLVNDGMNRFGFGCHESGDEIMLDKYNVVTIYSRILSKYNDFFEAHEINRVSQLVTAWDTFSDDTPGQAERYDYNGNWQNEIKSVVQPNGKHFSESYLRTIQSQFNSIINYALNKGYMKSNPLVDIKNMGIKDKRVEFWTPEEYEKFAYYAMEYPQYYYAYEVLYWCGLRIGELLALSLSDIDFEGGIISVTKTYNQLSGREIISTPKTPSSVRKVSMPAFLVDELKEYIGLLYEPKEDQRIFQISKSKINSNFHKLSDQAGLKRITIHGLRHSHVSLLISKKYDIFEVSKRIGHKSVKTTQDIYGHLFDDVQKSIANDLNMIRRGGV